VISHCVLNLKVLLSLKYLGGIVRRIRLNIVEGDLEIDEKPL